MRRSDMGRLVHLANKGVVTVVTIIGQLSAEDLARWRILCARQEALNHRPEAWSRAEIESHALEYYRFLGEIAARYEIDDSREWRVSAWTGVVYYTD